MTFHTRRTRPFIIQTAIAAVITVTGLSLAVPAPAQAASKACTDSTPSNQRPMLRHGDTGSCVKVAQRLLAKKGALKTTDTGNFLNATKAAVVQVQRQAGVAQDGIIGPVTWGVLTGGARTTKTAHNSGLPSKCLRNAKTICIVKGRGSEGKLYAVQNKSSVKSFPIRTGDARGSEYTTSTGSFSVGRKYEHYVSKAYDAPMPYSMFFNRGQAIHYSEDFDVNGYGGAGSSRGCVNIGTVSDARWLYNWSPRGTSVIVTR